MFRSMRFVFLGLAVWSTCCLLALPAQSRAASPEPFATPAKPRPSEQPSASTWRPGMYLAQGLRRVFQWLHHGHRSLVAPSAEVKPSPCAETPVALSWHSDYGHATREAQSQRRLLVILFHAAGDKAAAQRLANQAGAVPEVIDALRQASRAALSVDARLEGSPEADVLLAHPAFAGLHGGPGLAVIDYTADDPARRGQVIAALAAPADGCWNLGRLANAFQAKVPPIRWQSDYFDAVRLATKRRQMLFVLLRTPGQCPLSDRFEKEALADPEVRFRLAQMACVKLPLDTQVPDGQRRVALIEHPAFAEMQHLPGLAIVDYASTDPRLFGQVVSVFPFLEGQIYRVEQMKAILDLPPGTLTQRTLIYAVRTHPERPASANGRFDPVLAAEAESHSEYQARILRQGHHFWESRFHRINARLPAGCLAFEVCAESWPGQGLLQGAIECVRCWRLSAGHWRSVSSPCTVYGYDMKRGANGVWYATGIFGR